MPFIILLILINKCSIKILTTKVDSGRQAGNLSATIPFLLRNKMRVKDDPSLYNNN